MPGDMSSLIPSLRPPSFQSFILCELFLVPNRPGKKGESRDKLTPNLVSLSRTPYELKCTKNNLGRRRTKMWNVFLCLIHKQRNLLEKPRSEAMPRAKNMTAWRETSQSLRMNLLRGKAKNTNGREQEPLGQVCGKCYIMALHCFLVALSLLP